MVFIRLKNINGYTYAYVVKSHWDKKKKASRQKVIAYIGKVKGMDYLDAKKIFHRDKFTCQLCGFMQDLTIDHKIPLTKGGSNDLSNLWTLCKKCNSKKGVKFVKKETNLKQFRDFYW